MALLRSEPRNDRSRRRADAAARAESCFVAIADGAQSHAVGQPRRPLRRAASQSETIELATTDDGESTVKPTWVDYEAPARDRAVVIVTTLRVHSRVMDL
jgi:hypothetical protein